jgi:hypothetical protein
MLMLPSGGVAMALIEGVTQQCLKCGAEAFPSLPDYSAASWQIVECPACRFVYRRNPPEYKQLVNEFAREKTWMAEVERRKACSPVRMWLDRMTHNRRLLEAKWCGFRYPDHVNYFTTQSLRSITGDCGLRLKLLNPLCLPLDDNINAVLKRGQDMTAANA